jgi:hypothetical protein
MKKYKLTDQNMRTYNGFQWKLGEEVIANGKNDKLCNNSWLHYYHHPLLAILLNPIHVGIQNPRLFEVEALGKHLNDRGLKGGCTKMTLIKEIPLPVITTTQKVAFGILCAVDCYKEETFVRWANNWLKGRDRGDAAARAAARAAGAAAANLTADDYAAAAARTAAHAAAAAADYADYAADYAANLTADGFADEYAAALEKQNRKLTQMVMKYFKEQGNET